MANVPSTAAITGTPIWSNSTPFDGYLYLGLVLPQNANGQWPTAALAGQTPPQRLPIWTVVPITAGVFDQNTRVFQNPTLDPPNTQYVAYWYDLNLRRIFPAIGVAPTPFTIATDPYAISIPTLTIPSTSNNIPATSDLPNNMLIVSLHQYSTSDSTLTGTVDGTNRVFTLPMTLATAAVYLNGALMTQTQDVTLSGVSVTFSTSQVPQPGDVVTVVGVF